MTTDYHFARLFGTRRSCSRIGEPWGPYIVVRAVGTNPETSREFVLACPACGHEVTRQRSGFAQLNTVKKCRGCGRPTVKVEAAE